MQAINPSDRSNVRPLSCGNDARRFQPAWLRLALLSLVVSFGVGFGVGFGTPANADDSRFTTPLAPPNETPRRLPTVSTAVDSSVTLAAHIDNCWYADEGPDEQGTGEQGTGEQEDEKSLEERLAELEEKYSVLDEAHSDLKDSLKGYLRSGHSGSTGFKVYGRVHLDAWAFPDDSPGVNTIETGDPNDSIQDELEFRRLRFGVKGDLSNNMLYKIEMEFSGGEESEFRDSYLGWKELPILQTVLLGNQKRPYGLDHLNSSRFNVFLERPFVIEGFNQDARRIGIQSYGVSEDEAWNWRYGVFNQRLVQDEGIFISDHWQGQVAGRLANTIWWDEASQGRGYAHWAISGTWANTDQSVQGDGDAFPADSGRSEAEFNTDPESRTVNEFLDTGNIAGADDYFLIGLESVANVGPVQFVAEAQSVLLDRVGVASDIHLWGAYTYVSYFLTGEHMPWDRRSGTLGRIIPHENFFWVDTTPGNTARGLGAWQVAVRYSFADFSDDDIQGGIGENVTLGLNWYWTPSARMQFNYILGNVSSRDAGLAGGSGFIDGVDLPPPGTIVGGSFKAIGMRFMVDF